MNAGTPEINPTEAAEIERPADLRFYWSPWTKIGVQGIGLVCATGVLTGVLTTSSLSPAWLVLLLGALWLLSFPLFLWRAYAFGVRESTDGLSWRAQGRASPFCRGAVPWHAIKYFDYIEFPLIQDRVVVVLTDDTRKDVWSARPRMNWKGGRTEDFAELLNQRARAFGAPIDRPS